MIQDVSYDFHFNKDLIHIASYWLWIREGWTHGDGQLEYTSCGVKTERMIFWYQKSWLKSDQYGTPKRISMSIFWYQKTSFPDIINSFSDILNWFLISENQLLIMEYQFLIWEHVFLISENNFWYQDWSAWSAAAEHQIAGIMGQSRIVMHIRVRRFPPPSRVRILKMQAMNCIIRCQSRQLRSWLVTSPSNDCSNQRWPFWSRYKDSMCAITQLPAITIETRTTLTSFFRWHLQMH